MCVCLAAAALGGWPSAGRAAAAAAIRGPLDVVLVIDDSGSEFGARGTDPSQVRYRAARLVAEILAVTSEKGPRVRMGVVHFGTRASTRHSLPLVPFPPGLARVQTAIGSPENLGTTDFAAAIVRSGRILGPPVQGRRRVVVLLSDGQPFVTGVSQSADFGKIAAQVGAQRVRIDLLGIDRTNGLARLTSRWRPATSCTDSVLRNPTTAQLTRTVAKTLACEEDTGFSAFVCSAVALSHRAVIAPTALSTLRSLCKEGRPMQDHSPLALGIAAAVLVGVLAVLAFPWPWQSLRSGFSRSWLRGLIVGADNRTSTSKAVMLAWTLAIFYMLSALLIAKWLGTDLGWKKLVDKELQEAYLLLLGGPFAAAVLAKLSAVAKSKPGGGSGGKTVAAPGTATLSQLVSDDQGRTDIGDLQYVLFNGLTLVYVVVTFAGHLQMGLPDIPSVLTGLALTSAGGYTASKLLTTDTPTVTSLSPLSVAAGESFDLLGTSLVVSRGTLDENNKPAVAVPEVTVGGAHTETPVVIDDPTSGYDHLKVTLGPDTPSGPNQPVVVTRTDGVVAQARSGTPLVVTVTPSAAGAALSTLLALNRLASIRDG